MIRTFCAFAGYGGSEFALKQANIESRCVGFSEIDKYAIQCFEQNFPNVKNYGSITEIDWSKVEDFDLITGGFPCQDVSIAGKQDLDKGRTILGLELTKALIEKQPKWFLFENVKGLMSKRFTEFRTILIKSWESAGYIVIYKVLNTKHFGIPQNRERVWFVGIRRDIYKPFEFRFPEPEDLKLLLKDVLENKVEDKYFLSEEQTSRLLNGIIEHKRSKIDVLQGDVYNYLNSDTIQNKSVCSVLTIRDYKSPKCINISNKVRVRKHSVNIDGLKTLLRNSKNQSIVNISDKLNIPKTKVEHWFRSDNSFAVPDENIWFELKSLLNITTNEFDKQITEFEIKNSNYDMSNRVYSVNGIAPTLTKVSGGDQEKKIIQYNNLKLLEKTRNVSKAINLANEISIRENKPVQVDLYHLKNGQLRPLSTYIPQNLDVHRCIQASEPSQVLCNGYKIRKLTPKECFRLMGFLKDEINLDNLSNTQKYKLAGNGWTLRPASDIFKRMCL